MLQYKKFAEVIKMLGVVLAILLVLVFGAGAVKFFGKFAWLIIKFLFSVVVVTFKIICVAVGLLTGIIYLALKKFVPVAVNAIPYIISAAITFFVAVFAIGREFATGESALLFVETMLPKKEFPRRTKLSLALIELADSLRENFIAQCEMQIPKIKQSFGFSGGE